MGFTVLTAMWEPRGQVHESACAHHSDYLTWSSSTTWGFKYARDPPMANSASSNPAGICSDPPFTHRFLRLVLPPETGLSYSSHSLLMPFLIKYQPLSLCHLYLTPTILSFLSLSVFICSSVRWLVGTLARRRINDGVVVKEPDLYWDTGSFTPTFTNSHTSPSLLAKGSAMSDGSFTPSSTEIPPGGILHGNNSLLPQRRGSEKNIEHLPTVHPDDWKCYEWDGNSHEQ